MGHAIGLCEPLLFELDSLRELIEQPAAASEQDVDHVVLISSTSPAARNFQTG
jgi:hypothetical protein